MSVVKLLFTFNLLLVQIVISVCFFENISTQAEAMQESAQKEREKAIALTDCQLAEMMATLDTYKQNNERLISEKDAQIKALTAKLENAESLTVVIILT